MRPSRFGSLLTYSQPETEDEEMEDAQAPASEDSEGASKKRKVSTFPSA